MLSFTKRYHYRSVIADSLASKTHLDLHDQGLVSWPGGKRAVARLKECRSISVVNLGHNALGVEGAQELIRYLCLNPHTCKIVELNLNACNLETRILKDLGTFLKDNHTIQTLSLQNNLFQMEEAPVTYFTACCNTSSLNSLAIAGNEQLGDAFAQQFLSQIAAPRLQQLSISVLGLTEASSESILGYLESPRSRGLLMLKCNGNKLMNGFANRLLDVIRNHNFSLMHIELHGNLLNTQSPTGTPEIDVSPVSSLGSSHFSTAPHDNSPTEPKLLPWLDCQKILHELLERNRLYAALLVNQAVRLLPYARIILLHPRSVSPSKTGLHSLPMELQVTILHFLAPMLSPSQCYRICNYAADEDAIPLPQPWFEKRDKSKERTEWLYSVNCKTFEPFEGWEEVITELLKP